MRSLWWALTIVSAPLVFPGISTAQQSENPSLLPLPAVLRESAAAKDPAAEHQLLQQRLGELAAVRAEIAQLRAAVRAPAQVSVRLEMVEISLKKLSQVAGAFEDPTQREIVAQLQSSGTERIDLLDADSLAKVLASLRKQGAATFVCEPTLIARVGAKSSYFSGGEFPIQPSDRASRDPVQFGRYGVEASVTPRLLGGDQVRLDLQLRVTEVDHSTSVEVEGVRIPGIKVREDLSSGAVGTIGMTSVLKSQVSERVEHASRESSLPFGIGAKKTQFTDDVLTLVLVTARAVDELAAEGDVGAAPATALTPRRSPERK